MSLEYTKKLLLIITEKDPKQFEYLRLTCEQLEVLKKHTDPRLWYTGATRSQSKFAGLLLVLRGSILDHQYREMKCKRVHIDITKVERDEQS